VFVMLVSCWFWLFRRNGQRTEMMVPALAVAAGLVDAVGLAQLAGLRPLPWLAAGDQRSAFFGNVNLAGQFLGFAIVVLAFGARWRGQSRRARVGAWARGAVLVLSLAYLYLLSNRSVLLGLALAASVPLAVRFRSLPPRGRAALAAAVCLVALGLVWRTGGGDPVVEGHKAQSVLQRLEVWRATVRMIAERPSGVGAGNFGLDFPPYLAGSRLAADETVVFLSPHNEPLRILAEDGILFGGLLVAVIVALAVELRRSPAIGGWRSGAGALLAPAVVLLAVEALFQFPLATAFGALMAAALLGLALACVEGTAGGPRPMAFAAASRRRLWAAGAAFLAVGVTVALARVAAAEYLFVNHRDDVDAQRRACALDPRRTPSCVTAAWLEARAGDLAAARARLVRVLRQAPYDGPATKLLGEVALAQGDHEAGCLYLWLYDGRFGGRSSAHAMLVARCHPARFGALARREPFPYGRAFPLAARDAATR
jgi:type II secretory pathway component PulM